MDCFTPVLVDPTLGGITGAIAGGVVGVIEGRLINYIDGIDGTVPQDWFAFVAGATVLGVSFFALEASKTIPKTREKLKKLQAAGEYVANHHNELGRIISENKGALEFAKFLMQKKENDQHHNSIENFSLEDSAKLATLKNTIKNKIDGTYQDVYPYQRYTYYGTSYNYRSLLLQHYFEEVHIGNQNARKIEEFNNQISNDSQTAKNIKAIFHACETHAYEKILIAFKIQEKRDKLDKIDMKNIHVSRYINKIISQYSLFERYCRTPTVTYEAQCNDIIPTFSPYVIPKAVILSLLSNNLSLQTLAPLEVESPLTVGALKDVRSKYKEDVNRINQWQALISYNNSNDNIVIIASYLFNDYDYNLGDRFKAHQHKLKDKQDSLDLWIRLASKPDEEKDVLDSLQEKSHLWRIDLPENNIKG